MLQHSYEYTCFVIARFLWLDDSVEDSGGSGEGAGDLNSKKTKQYPLFVTSGKVFVLFFFFGGGGAAPKQAKDTATRLVRHAPLARSEVPKVHGE